MSAEEVGYQIGYWAGMAVQSPMMLLVVLVVFVALIVWLKTRKVR